MFLFLFTTPSFPLARGGVVGRAAFWLFQGDSSFRALFCKTCVYIQAHMARALGRVSVSLLGLVVFAFGDWEDTRFFRDLTAVTFRRVAGRRKKMDIRKYRVECTLHVSVVLFVFFFVLLVFLCFLFRTRRIRDQIFVLENIRKNLPRKSRNSASMQTYVD